MKTITKEQVEDARKKYKQMNEQYHNQNNTTVRITTAPDGYRGDLSCIKFIDSVEKKNVRGDGVPYQYDIYKNGVMIGVLTSYYGNHGDGKIASQSFASNKGVNVIWV